MGCAGFVQCESVSLCVWMHFYWYYWCCQVTMVRKYLEELSILGVHWFGTKQKWVLEPNTHYWNCWTDKMLFLLFSVHWNTGRTSTQQQSGNSCSDASNSSEYKNWYWQQLYPSQPEATTQLSTPAPFPSSSWRGPLRVPCPTLVKSHLKRWI